MLDIFWRVQAWLLTLFLDDSGGSDSDSGGSDSDSGDSGSGDSDSGSSDGSSEASGSAVDSSDVSDSNGSDSNSSGRNTPGAEAVQQVIPPVPGEPRPEDLANIPPPPDLPPGDWPTPPTPPQS